MEPWSSTCEGDRHMPSQTFCTKFNSEQFLIAPFFDIMLIFGIVEPGSESSSPFLYIIRFRTYWPLEPPGHWWRERNAWARRPFSTKFNSEQILFEPFFVWYIFLAALSPKLNVIWCFCTILYFNHINLSSPLAPLQRDRHMH